MGPHNYLLCSTGWNLGLATFADLASGVTPDQRRSAILLEEAELADQLGLEPCLRQSASIIATDSLVSTPPSPSPRSPRGPSRCRALDAVTVLSSDDPVRVSKQTRRARSTCRAAGRGSSPGRGSFVESFPLFGYDLDDYDELFAEKLELLLKIRSRPR